MAGLFACRRHAPGQDLLHVARAHGGLVGFGPVGQYQHGGLLRPGGKVLAEDHGKVGLSPAEEVVDIGHAVGLCRE